MQHEDPAIVAVTSEVPQSMEFHPLQDPSTSTEVVEPAGSVQADAPPAGSAPHIAQVHAPFTENPSKQQTQKRASTKQTTPFEYFMSKVRHYKKL